VLIRADYSDLTYALNHRSKQVFLDGVIKLRAECGIPTRIRTRVMFGDGYPGDEPLAFEIGNLFLHTADRHFYSDGCCCLWLPVESQWKSDNPTALHTFLDHVSTFFERQLIYDASPEKQWAWGQRGHGIKGYLEFIQDRLGNDTSLIGRFVGVLSGKEQISPNSHCPCLSGKKYKSCHLICISKLVTDLGTQNPFLSRSDSSSRASAAAA